MNTPLLSTRDCLVTPSGHEVGVSKPARAFAPYVFDWLEQAEASPSPEWRNRDLRVRTLVSVPRWSAAHPQAIFEFFGCLGAMPTDPEQAWQVVHVLRQTISRDLLTLTARPFFLDWSPVDGALCIWHTGKTP